MSNGLEDLSHIPMQKKIIIIIIIIIFILRLNGKIMVWY